MPTRTANAEWKGGVKGQGSFRGQTGLGGQYSFSSRFENGAGSNPEELLAAAEAACFSMALSFALEKEGHPRDERRDEGRLHDREGGRGLQDHAHDAHRARDGAGRRSGEVPVDRAGDEGRMPGVNRAEGQRPDRPRRQARLTSRRRAPTGCARRSSSRWIDEPDRQTGQGEPVGRHGRRAQPRAGNERGHERNGEHGRAVEPRAPARARARTRTRSSRP